MFVFQALFAVWGHNLIHLVNKIATVVLAVSLAVITVLALTEVEIGAAAPSSDGGGIADWVTFAGFFFIYVMTWTPFASDFSRYLPRSVSKGKSWHTLLAWIPISTVAQKYRRFGFQFRGRPRRSRSRC